MMVVSVATEPDFSSGTPEELFTGLYALTPFRYPNYDVSLDGQRLLMVKAEYTGTTTPQINVVLNWFEELKQKVPAN